MKPEDAKISLSIPKGIYAGQITEEDGKTYNVFAAEKDAPELMTYDEAREWVLKYDDGKWIIPSKEILLNNLHRNKDKIPGLKDGWYWSSSVYLDTSYYVWCVRLAHGIDFWNNKAHFRMSCRPVRVELANNSEEKPMPEFKITTPGEYKTRDGHKAVVLGIRPEEIDYPVVGYVIDETDSSCWRLSGRFIDDIDEDELDIIAPWPVEHRGWVNIYSTMISYPYETKEKADKEAQKSRIACIEIKWTEGEGL